MKKILSFLTSFVLILSCVCVFNFSASAAGRSVISFSKKQVNVGEKVTVTVKINADEPIYAIEFALNYDPDILEFINGDDCSGGAGVISVAAGNTTSSTTKSFTFKASKAGSCYISTGDMVCVNANEDLISVPTQGASLNVKNKQLSGNSKLKSLSISGGKLNPAFSSGRTSYTVAVNKDVTSCNIYASAADSSAKVRVEGASNLRIGKNNCRVIVTAANGTQKIYNIIITRKNDVSKNEVSSKNETSSDVSSSEDTESSDSADKDSLKTVIDGKDYFVLNTLEGVKLPNGYTAQKTLFKQEEITVAVDENQTYSLYYLGTKDSKTAEPYTYDAQTDTFNKLSYMNQGEIFYIFADIPDGFEVGSGFYSTNTQIGDFNIPCYSSIAQEFSAFYYIYCYNGDEYGFYRYDSVENVLQRYPELSLKEVTPLTQDENQDTEAGFITKFRNLTTNAKIIIVGIVLAIFALLVLIVLFFIKLFYRRGEAEFVSNLDYTEDFDDIEYNSAFAIEHSETFLTEDNEETDIAFDEDDLKSPDEIESEYVTEETEED